MYVEKKRWFILDYVMGSGKTITAINIFSQYKGNKIIIGNDVS